ncbi:MAG TPA: 2-oxoglutarate dehydrogenase E1 component, partial [Kaistia sp.]|nr:2-oxoglutarate dehydrogenase E1 component [Kaistia sp.]
MSREQANAAFATSSFLYGGNATYIEDLYARYQNDPASVDPEWQSFFSALKDDPKAVLAEARGAPWKRADWPLHANGELVSAMDGNWGQIEKTVTDKLKAKAAQGAAPAANGQAAAAAPLSEAAIQQAARDSVRAIMMIRAYRMRGHLHADLDPLHIATAGDHEELHPSSYG